MKLSENILKHKRAITDAVIIAMVLILVLVGAIVFKSRQFAFVTVSITILTLFLAFLSFEKKQSGTRYLVLIATMTALSVAGRLAFYPIAFFKPVCAMVIICGIYIDSRAAFICGSLSALISGFFFGLGAWIPFQMLAWGFIGYLSGLLAVYIKKSKIFMIFYATLSAFVFSAFLDIFTVLSYDDIFNMKLYIATLVNALPMIAIYIISNIAFLLTLSTFIGKKITHMRTKYGF